MRISFAFLLISIFADPSLTFSASRSENESIMDSENEDFPKDPLLEPEIGIDRPIGDRRSQKNPTETFERDSLEDTDLGLLEDKSPSDTSSLEDTNGKKEKRSESPTINKRRGKGEHQPDSIKNRNREKENLQKTSSKEAFKNKKQNRIKKSLSQEREEADELENEEDFEESNDAGLADEASALEKVFQGEFPGDISRKIDQFGYDLFLGKKKQFRPIDSTPASADYRVGPGDTFILSVWGAINFTRSLTIRPDGNLFIPKVGVIGTQGLSFKELSNKIDTRMTRMFAGVKTNLTLEELKGIDIFVIGEVKAPGTYSLPGTSSVINALFFAGGPKKTGSLRNIKLLRGDKEVAVIDLYDFLVSGKSISHRLQSQDVILVPVIGKTAAVAGNVKRPAIYEIKDGLSLFDLVRLAGGLTFTGEVGRMSLERVDKNRERVIKDYQIPSNFSQLTPAEVKKSELGQEVHDGDFVKVFPVLKTLKKTVVLRGYVKRPGTYEFRPGMRILDLIPNYDSLLAEPYLDFVQIIRTDPPKDERRSLFVNLRSALEGDSKANIELQDRDQIVVFSRTQLNLSEKVWIVGKVNKPGSYFYFPGMRLRDLIYMAGNLKQDAYMASAEIARYTIKNDGLQFDRVQANLNNLLVNGSEADNPPLQPKDRVSIQGLPNWELKNFIQISGEVKYPGQYAFSPNEHLSSVLSRAGGYTDKAFLPGAIYTRISVKEIQQKSLTEQVNQLEKAILQESISPTSMSSQDMASYQDAIASRQALLDNLKKMKASGRMIIQLAALSELKEGRYDFVLEPQDTLKIPPTPSTVTVMGEVYNQTSMVYVAGKSVKYYLDQTGGVTMNADAESIFIIRADGSVISRRQNRGFLLKNFFQTEVQRGDTILVPKDIARFSWLSTTKDLTDILFKIASTTGITITAFK